MSKEFKSIEGIIFRDYNSGVNDKVVLMITHNGSKFPFLVKGVRKQNSKKSHAIEMGNKIKLKYVLGYSLPIATDIKVIQNNQKWKKEVDKNILLQMICETLTHFSVEESDDPQLFKLFDEVLSTQPNSENFVLLSAVYLFKLLQISGSLPDLSVCLSSGVDLSSDSVYSNSFSIGYVAINDPENIKMDSRVYKTQRFIEQTNIESSASVKLDTKESIDFLKQMFSWVEIVTERELKSKKVVLSILK